MMSLMKMLMVVGVVWFRPPWWYGGCLPVAMMELWPRICQQMLKPEFTLPSSRAHSSAPCSTLFDRVTPREPHEVRFNSPQPLTHSLVWLQSGRITWDSRPLFNAYFVLGAK